MHKKTISSFFAAGALFITGHGRGTTDHGAGNRLIVAGQTRADFPGGILRRARGRFLALAPTGRAFFLSRTSPAAALIAHGAGKLPTRKLGIGRPRGLCLSHPRGADTGLAASGLGPAARQRGRFGRALDNYRLAPAVTRPGSARAASRNTITLGCLDGTFRVVTFTAATAFPFFLARRRCRVGGLLDVLQGTHPVVAADRLLPAGRHRLAAFPGSRPCRTAGRGACRGTCARCCRA